jgi:hypothetical protein
VRRKGQVVGTRDIEIPRILRVQPVWVNLLPTYDIYAYRMFVIQSMINEVLEA